MFVINATSPVSHIAEFLNIDILQAAAVRGLVDGSIDPQTVPETEQWVRDCYNMPYADELIMHAIDATIETFGVESAGGNGECYHFDYCNAGDTYATTVIYDRQSGEYMIGCWGDLVEMAEENDIDY